MKSKKGYRLSGRFKEILDVLLKAVKSQDNCLWRPENRKLVSINIHQIHPEENTVEISFKVKGSSSLAVGDLIYLKIGARDSAFKTTVLSLTPIFYTLEFPDEIALSELRAESRKYFHPSDEKIVRMKRIKNNVSTLAEKSSDFMVADISLTGIALLLNASQTANYKLNDRISLESVGPFELNPPITGEIVFKMAHETKKSLGIVEHGSKVGIHLDKKIPKITYDRFCIREKVFSISEEQIVRDQSFRKDVNERMGTMVKNLVLKRNLHKLFERFDMKQVGHQYLKQHNEFLAEVMCGLGTKLGWVSDATMDKLIYVAHLHDARYFSLPHLARIPSEKEFDRVKKNLTADEQKVYLEGPEYASELARQDSESYPDAAKILLQQKELPDGSGFPYGITNNQFIPLSCLFIVSHYFVDYVYDNTDWSVTDFVKTHQKFLKGTYFQKIFAVMRD